MNWIRWLDSFPWQPVPVHTLPLNQDRWGKGDQLLWQRWWRLCSFFQQKIIHSVLGEKADCPRAEQLLNEVGTIINFSRKSQWVFYFTSLMYLIIHQAKCFFQMQTNIVTISPTSRFSRERRWKKSLNLTRSCLTTSPNTREGRWQMSWRWLYTF